MFKAMGLVSQRQSPNRKLVPKTLTHLFFCVITLRQLELFLWRGLGCMTGF